MIATATKGRVMELFDAFIAYQQTRGFAKTTIARRTTTIRRFLSFIAPTDIGGATPELIEEFLLQYSCPRTRHAYRSDLRVLYLWAFRRGLVPRNPMDLIDPVKVPHSLPRPVPAVLIPGILASTEDSDTRLMIALAAFAGLRVAEIAALTSDDIDFAHSLLMVRLGKGARDRLIPIHPLLYHLLLEKQAVRGRIFTVGARTVGRRIQSQLSRCEIAATPHKLRHSFGTELAKAAQGNLIMVQRLMGHADPKTTQGYVGWAGGEAAATVAGMYPAAS